MKTFNKKLLEAALVCLYLFDGNYINYAWAAHYGLNLNPSVIHQSLKISEHTINNSPSAREASERPTQSSLKQADKLNPVQYLFC